MNIGSLIKAFCLCVIFVHGFLNKYRFKFCSIDVKKGVFFSHKIGSKKEEKVVVREGHLQRCLNRTKFSSNINTFRILIKTAIVIYKYNNIY